MLRVRSSWALPCFGFSLHLSPAWLPGTSGDALHYQLAQIGFSAHILDEVGTHSTRLIRHKGGDPVTSRDSGTLAHSAGLCLSLGMPLKEPF